MRDRLKIRESVQPIQRNVQGTDLLGNYGRSAPSSNLLISTSSRNGDVLPVTAYAMLVKHRMTQYPLQVQQSLLQLQQQYGNQYVQHVLMRQQQEASRSQNQIRPVQITVTSTVTGTARLNPFRREDRTRQTEVVYQVPLYAMVVAGQDASGADVQEPFDVVRFGIRWLPDGTHRVVGLANAQTRTLTWTWSASLGGSWRIYGDFLIHVGATDPNTPVGAIGCIEVVGGRWRSFLNLITRLAGVSDNAQISQAGNLTVTFEAATRPDLRQVATPSSNGTQSPRVRQP